ncbi:MAG: hypothetical protein M1838_002689 [Thelocarpon superellum]|nr:MAG: hypothetical protein M1838_002689 [Thelocarpon superellum]
MSAPACKDCVSGFKHSGTPVGIETSLHGYDAYVSKPPSGQAAKALIVLIPDGFGWKFPNMRVVADTFAAKGGYLVYVPDVFNGPGMDEKVLLQMSQLMTPAPNFLGTLMKPMILIQILSGFLPFLYRNRVSVCGPRVKAFVAALRKTETLPIGMVGYCWGGKHAILAAHNDNEMGKPLVDAVFTAHPSGLDVPADINNIRVPTSIAVGTKDMVMNMKVVDEVQTLLSKKADVPYEVVTYEGAKHGFAARGNPNEEKEAEHAAQAEDQALTWFAKYLVASAPHPAPESAPGPVPVAESTAQPEPVAQPATQSELKAPETTS